MTTHTWTENDVTYLVNAARNAVNAISQSNAGAKFALRDALKPFQPDPDAELVRKIDRMRVDPSPRTATDIIAAVREHDARSRNANNP